MKKFFLFFLLSFNLIAANGDILGAYVDTNGWMLRLRISGLDVGGTYNLGWNTNHYISPTNRIKLWISSPGFDDTGISNSNLRLVMGTMAIPTNATVTTPYYEQSADGETWITVGLTSLIRTEDTILGMDAIEGAYTSGATPTIAISNLFVTNTSLQSWSINKTIANWTWTPNYYTISNSIADMRINAYHISGQNGRPVRYVDFWSIDSAGTRSPTNRIYTPIIRSTLPDMVPIIEYCGDIDYSGLGQGLLVTNHFRAVPWLGIEACIIDTSDGVNELKPYYYARRITVCDRLGLLGHSYTVVDAINGNDTTGVVVSNFTGAIAPFLTIGKAASSIQSSNSIWYARTNCGQSIIYLTNGNHDFRGAAPAATIQANLGYLTITAYPGLDYTSVAITNSSSSGDLGDRIRFNNIAFRPLTVANTVYANTVDHLWVDSCWLEATNSGTQIWSDCTNTYYTFNIITNWGARMTHPGTSGTAANTHMSLIRGNDMRGYHRNIAPQVMVGNLKWNTNNYSPEQLIIICAPGFSGEINQNDGAIVAFNKLMGCKFDGNDVVKIATETNISFGIAIIQNVIESAQQGSSGQTASFGTVNRDSISITNMLSWYNSWLGGKMNVFYDYTNGTHWAIGCSFIGDYTEDWNQKTGNFSPTSEIGYGGWAVQYGVDNQVHISSEITGAPGDFFARFSGINGWMSEVELTNSWAHHINRAAYYFRIGNGEGNGNYQLTSYSPLFRWFGVNKLPFDINGIARSNMDPSGAYSSGNRKKGSMF